MKHLRGWIGASALAISAFVASDSGVETAQSLTIPTVCADPAQCAAFCHGVAEQGRREGDFIALAAYQLGPAKAIDLPPANLSMPAPVDPKNVYAGTGAGMFSPAVAGQLSRVYSPNLITGKVDVIDPETFTVSPASTPFRARSISCRPGTCRRCGCRATSAIAAAMQT